MMRIKRSSISFLVLMVLLITACAAPRITSNWKDQSYQGQLSKIMVIGVAKKQVNKRIFEDEFVRQLKARGINAVASYTVMPDLKQSDHPLIAAKMKEQGADAVLISSLVSKNTVRSYIGGTVYHPPETYGSWRDYYHHDSDEIYTPGYMAEDDYALKGTNLYSAGTDKLIWSAASDTEILSSDPDQIKSFIGVMVNAMAEHKLLK